MSLEDTIKKDMIVAMKAQDQKKLSVLRMIKAAMTNYMIKVKKENIEDAEIMGILQKEIKQRRESVENFQKAARQDLVDKEIDEMKIIQTYLPPELTDGEIAELAKKSIANVKAQTMADIGKVMKDLMPVVKGKADGKRVNEIIAHLLKA